MSALGTALGIIAAKVRGRSLARRLAGRTRPTTPIAVYFADAPSSLYQLQRWYHTLEALDTVHRTSIITSDPATYETVREQTSLEVTFADGAAQLGRVIDDQSVKVILYPNHNALNFRVLRFAAPVHVFIGHGESAKESSFSRQLKAYDFSYVANSEAMKQLRGIRGYDAKASAVVIGSPWLGFPGDPPAAWQADDRTVVLYAPTWEGDRPTMDYSSVETMGERIVATVLATPNLRLIYRPHPWLGRVRAASAAADARIRRSIARAERDDVVDTGEYGWALAAAQVCITDVSSVAFDARALGAALVITVPTSTSIPPVPDEAWADATRLAETDVAGIRSAIDAALRNRAGHPEKPTTSMDALIGAIENALKISGTGTL